MYEEKKEIIECNESGNYITIRNNLFYINLHVINLHTYTCLSEKCVFEKNRFDDFYNSQRFSFVKCISEVGIPCGLCENDFIILNYFLLSSVFWKWDVYRSMSHNPSGCETIKSKASLILVILGVLTGPSVSM